MFEASNVEFRCPIFALGMPARGSRDAMGIVSCSLDVTGANFIESTSFSLVDGGDGEAGKGKRELSVSGRKQTDVVFPVTDVSFIDEEIQSCKTFATTSDTLRIWRDDAENENLELIEDIRLNNFSCPLTAVDFSGATLICSSTDCTVSIIDINKMCVRSRIMPHDHPIYDCSFCGDSNTIISCGFDGSVREIDNRDISHMSVLYQSTTPVLRCAVNPNEKNIVGLFTLNSNNVTIIDRRNYACPLCVTRDCSSYITDFKWANETPPNQMYYNSSSLYISNEKGQILFSDLSEDASILNALVFHETMYPIESINLSKTHISYSSNNRVTILEI